MNIKEKVVFFKGLVEGLNLKQDEQKKIVDGIVEILYAMAEEIEQNTLNLDEINEYVDEMSDRLDIVDEGLFETAQDLDYTFNYLAKDNEFIDEYNLFLAEMGSIEEHDHYHEHHHDHGCGCHSHHDDSEKGEK